MTKLLLSLFISFLFFSCSKTEPDLNLVSVVDDKELAEALVGKWIYTLIGNGKSYYTETISFDRNSPHMSKTVAYNKYETISDAEFSTSRNKINIRKNIMEVESDVQALRKFYRIEIRRNEITLHERPDRDNPRNEMAGRKYVKDR